MKLLDVLNASKENPEATKVFINPDDTKNLPAYPNIAVDHNFCLGKGAGLLWYEDAAQPIGTFRLE